MNKYYLTITGMMIVTFIPRLLPFLLIRNKKIPSKLEKFLGYVPAAVLGALILPGIFSVFPENIYASSAAGIFALIFSYYRDNILVTVAGSIAIAYFMFIL